MRHTAQAAGDYLHAFVFVYMAMVQMGVYASGRIRASVSAKN